MLTSRRVQQEDLRSDSILNNSRDSAGNEDANTYKLKERK